MDSGWPIAIGVGVLLFINAVVILIGARVRTVREIRRRELHGTVVARREAGGDWEWPGD